MSEIDIVLLGMLKKHPQSAYDLQKAVDYRSISYWVKISSPSIYKNVKQLEEKGYIVGDSVKCGNMSPKTIYSVTDEGMKFMKTDMFKMSEKEVRLFQGMNAVILHMDLLSVEEQKQCMDNIYEQITLLKNHMEEKKIEREKIQVPINGQMIIEQQEELIQVLENWILKYRKG